MKNTVPDIHRKNHNHLMSLQEAIWVVAFLKDVATAQALTSGGGRLGVTQDGEQGLAIILAGVEESLNKVMEQI